MNEGKSYNWRGNPELREKAKEFRKPQTSAEDLLWSELRGRKLNRLKFRRQHPIKRVIADFCCPDLKLVVEVDGSVHEKEEQRIHDKARDEWLADRGDTILRFTNDQVASSLTEVLNTIQKTAKSLSC